MSPKLPRRVLRSLLASLCVLPVLAIVTVLCLLRGSLAYLDGHRHLPGLAASAQVDRDALGIPTVHASNLPDLVRAVGFVHAQERFFQMDLLRRSAAGELAELLGAPTLDFDRARRLHQMRGVARGVVHQLPPDQLNLLSAYTEGVNAGLQALHVRPPEYLALRQSPASWLPEDSVLVIHAMAFDLQDANGGTEHALGLARQALGAAAFHFYFPTGTEWEAALDGSTTPSAPVPTPAQFSARSSPDSALLAPLSPLPSSDTSEELAKPGSNAWAVGGKRTATGAALVANDMHLGLGLPNIWFRMSLVWADPSHPGRSNRVIGVTLPGCPAVVTGSNGHIAWGFTNATIDNSDLVDLDLNPDHPNRYLTPGGWETIETTNETIRVSGSESHPLTVRTTRWGPVVSANPPQAIRWTFHSPDAVNLRFLDLATATNALQALDIAAAAGIPAQNFLVGDTEGHIGWTLTGTLPNRVGFEGRLPTRWADGTCRWNGWIPVSEKPRVYDPAEAILWSANQRMSGTTAYQRAGDGDFDLGARAGQIRDRLRALDHATPADMLAIQLDDEAWFLQRWQRLMLEHLPSLAPTTPEPVIALARRELEHWGAAANTNSAGYHLVRQFRDNVVTQLLQPAFRACTRAGAPFPWTSHREGPAWTLLQGRPAHLLPPSYASYDRLIRSSLGGTLHLCITTNTPPRVVTWGERNTSRIRHPLSQAVPRLSRWLDLAPDQLPGDNHMPRVLAPSFGASERFGVSPGREPEGYCHMPGGQSGHFLSPFYRAGHPAWVEGTPLPFLPGPVSHTLTLVP